jgi:V/A-type H+-transporting ATPase subunit E
MNTKIKELTENIYNEGVAKAREEADLILKEANKKAEETVAEANAKAEATLSKAKSESEKIYASLKEDLQQTKIQVMEITKQTINNLVTAKTSKVIAGQLSDDPKFIKDLVLEITRNWSKNNGHDHQLETLVPESMISKLEPLFKTAASEEMNSKLTFKPVPQLKQGFQIVNDKEGFKISFTDEDFEIFFASLMKPKIREYLFNSEN